MKLPKATSANANEKLISFNWKENAAAKKLLDTLVLILKDEYIQKAKENPEIFSK